MAGSKKYEVYVKSGTNKKAVKKAVKRINNKLGSKVVKVTSNRKKADAVVKSGNPRGSNAGYTTTGGKKDRITISRSVDNNPLAKRSERRLAEHEIGHGLGLEHRTGARNIMNPNSGGGVVRKNQRKQVKQTYRKGGYK